MAALCPVCSGSDVEVQALFRGTHPAFNGLKRVLCRTCGMVFADPMPLESDLDRYNSSYFSTAHGGKPTSPASVAFFSGIASLRCSHIVRYIEAHNISASRLLEFGPGTGYFADTWLKKYPETEYFGCETDTSCHASLQKKGVKLITDYPRNEATRSIDLVVMSHVLEHVTKPVEFLSDATHHLRAGGALFIEVPCLDYEHKSQDEPHLLFFDKQPMSKLLTRCGFENIRTSYHGLSLEHLKQVSKLREVYAGIRSRFISNGVIAPFSRKCPGMEALSTVERAVLSPYNAHIESSRPAWWLRVVATKQRH
ncbi:MAG: class I SAM-dependent methyltransferase [Chlorobium sp.]|nr:MAG: class I SAM-dependent methyltransferase [Chlorobium sp.]